MKRCPRCGETKPPEGFSRCRSRKDGLQPWCKRCQSLRAAEREADQEHKDREAMRKRGGDGSATYGGPLDKMDEVPFRCMHRMFTVRPCRKLATRVSPTGAKWCDDHGVGELSPLIPGSEDDGW